MIVRKSSLEASFAMNAPAPQAVYAFFDFDETLVEQKSMFSFLKFYIENGTQFERSYNSIGEDIRKRKNEGAPREEINAFYYSLFEGHSRKEFRRAAEEFVDRGGLIPKRPVVDRMESHRRRGDTIIVVSGSSRDIIDPFLRRWEISEALCAEQETCGDRYTGRLSARAIGRHKAERVRRYCEDGGVSPSVCFAYGDDISDAPMLSVVGHPVAVDPGPDLLDVAQHHSWEIFFTTKGSCA